jgi:undecaprenyl-diphosphatase
MDQKLLFLINREWTGPALDRFMAVVTSAAFWMVPLILLGLALIVFGGFRARAFVVVALMAFVLNDSVVGNGIKRLVGRLRPFQSETGVRIVSLAPPAWKGMFAPLQVYVTTGATGETSGRSFPSNHSSNTASVAFLVTMFFRRWGWLAFAPALLVAYSRVYLGVHWPSDVLAGIFVGCGVALLTLLLAEWSWRRFGARVAPKIAAQHPSLLSRAA